MPFCSCIPLILAKSSYIVTYFDVFSLVAVGILAVFTIAAGAVFIKKSLLGNSVKRLSVLSIYRGNDACL